MGDYPPGFSLRMSELARLNGVSTIPVREAMRRLEAERLVESVANKGVRVARLSSTDLADAYQLRTILEAEAVRLAAGRLTDADRDYDLLVFPEERHMPNNAKGLEYQERKLVEYFEHWLR